MGHSIRRNAISGMKVHRKREIKCSKGNAHVAIPIQFVLIMGAFYKKKNIAKYAIVLFLLVQYLLKLKLNLEFFKLLINLSA